MMDHLDSHLAGLAFLLDGASINLCTPRNTSTQLKGSTSLPRREHRDTRRLSNQSSIVSVEDITPVVPDVTIIHGKMDFRSKILVGVEGGTPITKGLAQELRQLMTGSLIHVCTTDFQRAAFAFHDVNSKTPYGLIVERNGSRGALMCVQAFILKHLIYKYSTREEIRNRDVLHPTEWQRREALVSSLAEILWTAGQQKHAVLCLPCAEADCFQVEKPYRKDGFTEKLHLFEFTHHNELRNFIKSHYEYLEKPQASGVLCFLYSAILSRTVQQIKVDLCGTKLQLLTDNEDCSQAMVNLLLCGKATPFIHNGEVVYTDTGTVLTHPQHGIPERAEVGFMFWHRDEDEQERTQVGSMLKTPKRPVWVTHVNGQFGMVFSLNPDLVGDWRSEHTFTLHYYTGLATHNQNTRLTVETRFGRRFQSRTNRGKKEEEKRVPALDKCIMTKWYGAEVNWNGVMPYV